MKYPLGDIIHTGSETQIVASTDPDTGARVVLKMPREAAPSARLLDRLRHEYTMLCEMQAPGIVRVVELVPHGASLAIVMERWGAGSLGRLIERGPLPVVMALHLGAAIARVLGQVHRQGILHRDVKPHHVLVNAENNAAQLIDFALAVRRNAYVAENAAPETLAGTLSYMAPEQTGRMNRGIDWRADLYALGATLYQILTGVLVFEQRELSELVHAHLAHAPVPPHERAPAQQIPIIISALVLRLLAKNPEHRYQSADGVAFDLEQAARELRESGTVEVFPLATRDWANRVRKTSRLYGREDAIQALETAYRRVQGGAVEMVLVAGPSGVGKSALVAALSREVRETKGIFAAGKFDLIQRATPYLALSHAFRSIVRHRLAEPAEVLARWKAAWQEAAGPNGQILVNLMPELAHILGEPPALVEVGPAEERNRFMLTVQYFIRATATAEHPLVLFIDDFQWADLASMVLLQQILTDYEAKHVFLVGAYRNNEVHLEHALLALKNAVLENGRQVSTIELMPLGSEPLLGMVADMLQRPASEVEPLASLLKIKTDGSPFFVEQYLRALHEQRLLERDIDSGAWRWDTARIERAGVTDNVAELLTQKLGQLSAGAKRVLALGACVGANFETAVVREAEAMAESALWLAVEELQQQGLLRESAGAIEFVHDRVQQAAYALLGNDAERIEAHGALAQVFDRRVEVAGGNAELFAMLHHALKALPRLTDPKEKRHVAERCLRGGQRAKEGSAYADAVLFLRTGRELLGDAGWESAFALTFEVHFALAEAEWLAGRAEIGEVLFRVCEERAPDQLTHGRIAALWVQLLTISGRFSDAIAHVLEALQAFGWHFPSNPDEIQTFMAAQLGRIVPPLMNASNAELAAWPQCTDPEALVTGRLLIRAINAITMGRPELMPPICFAMVEHTLRHGVSRVTTGAAGGGATMAVLALQDLGLARRFVDLGQLHLPAATGHIAWGFHAMSLARQYLEPLRFCEEWEAAAEMGFREGDISFAEYCTLAAQSTRIVSGQSLLFLPPLLPTYTDFISRRYVAILQGLLAALTAPVPRDAWQIAETLPREALSVPFLLHNSHASVAFLALHLGDEVQALGHALLAEPHWAATAGGANAIIVVFTLCVSAARLPDQAASAQSQIDVDRARLEKWAAFTPQNFLHMKLLVDAWHACNESRHPDAEQLFELAIADARTNGFLNDEALGLRMAGEYFLQRSMPRAAAGYLRDAHDTYLRWGSPACANAIRERHPQFFATHAPEASRSEMALDVDTVVRAARALGGELDPERVVARLMELCLSNAGAHRGALIFLENESLVLVARLSAGDARIETGLSESVDQDGDVPRTILLYVVRSREPVVVNDVLQEKRFQDDYFARNTIRSLLALPLTYRGRLIGVLYLEHRDAPSAFPPARVELLSVLAAQAAIAVENAHLYRNVEAQVRALETRNREIEALNNELRRQIAQRSQRLMDTLFSSQTMALPSATLEEGQLLGDCYRILQRLGEGGMGTVFEVERTTDSARLAAKVLSHNPDRNELARFIREAQILSSVSHPNLVSIFDVDITNEGGPYIVMELCQGGSLRDIDVRAGGITRILSVLAQIADALATMHARSIVHRDLKPENILAVTTAPEALPIVKVADFGIAMIAGGHRRNVSDIETRSGGHRLTETGMLLGTPLYMAPELIHGSQHAEPPVDIFSLGVIAFELLVGSLPFSHPPFMLALSAEELPIPPGLRQCLGLRPELAALFEQCLRKDPAERPTAREIVAMIGV